MSLSSQTKKVQKLKFFQEIRSNSYLGIVSTTTTNVVIEMQLLIEVQSRLAIFLAA